MCLKMVPFEVTYFLCFSFIIKVFTVIICCLVWYQEALIRTPLGWIFEFCGFICIFREFRYSVWVNKAMIELRYMFLKVFLVMKIFIVIFSFCFAYMLYESSRRKPGWRFTAGVKFWIFSILLYIRFPSNLICH